MKLLLDQNLSPRLVSKLADVFPAVVHVQAIGLDKASDSAIWQYAQKQNLTIVSKDADFYERLLMHGSPPKIVWIRRGNCSTGQIERLLRHSRPAIENLGLIETGFLVLL
ncbi:MAG: DUF5615 family PIN-like protein [Acidobacteriota bacterium]